MKYMEPLCFCDLLKISFDISGTLAEQGRKERFFFGHSKNLQTMWELCSLSKIDMDISPGLQDEGDKMRIEDFNSNGFLLVTQHSKRFAGKYNHGSFQLFRE